MKKKKEEKLGFDKEITKRMFDVFIDCLDEKASLDEDASEERREVTKKKFKLLYEQHQLEDELDSLTHNTYVEIGEILNELLVKQNELLKKAAAKCKKWLDDNDMPYEEEGYKDLLEEEEDDEEDDW